MHMYFRFFGSEPMETFACFDLMKSPHVENHFERFEAHLNRLFKPVAVEA